MMDKLQVLRTVFQCVDLYDSVVNNRNFLFVCTDKCNQVKMIEVSFDKSNFQHLTGLKTDKTKISALDFYDRCINRRLSVNDFDIPAEDAIYVEKKMRVLPSMLTKDLCASMIGDYNGSRPKILTDKLAGGIKGCMGFKSTGKSKRLIPNTVLEEDVRTVINGQLRVILTYRKHMGEKKYAEIVHVARKVDWNTIHFPEEYLYLPLPRDAEKKDFSAYQSA